MKRVKRAAHAFVLVIALFAAFVVSGGAIVKATSDYDDVFVATSSTKVSDTYSNHSCTARDITMSWGNYLMDDSKWSQAVYGTGTNRETVQSALSTTLSNGDGLAVTEIEFLSTGSSIGNFVWGPGDYGVQVTFTPDTNNAVTFFTQGSIDYATLKGTGSAPVYTVILGQYWNSSTSSCSIGVAVSRVATSDISNSNFVSKGTYLGYNNPGPGSNYTYRQLFIDSTINQTGYEGESIPTGQPSAKYVAMGDSFSSGEGNPPFEYGTDESGVDECHRSPQAYPRLLQDDLSLGSTAFVACSGATTSSLYNSQESEPAQITALSEQTEIVTITIGGNDIGFNKFATACAVSICNFSTSAYSTITDKIDNELPESLQDTFDEIVSRISSSTKVYVVGYPHLAPPEMPTGANSACWPLNGSGDEPDPALNDGATVRDVISRLNSVIADTVNEMEGSHFVYIDPNIPGSPFIGHDWCTQDKFFDIVTYNNIDYSFHPNTVGQAAYKTIVKDVIE